MTPFVKTSAAALKKLVTTRTDGIGRSCSEAKRAASGKEKFEAYKIITYDIRSPV
jgi:hypothetical protein